MPADGAPTEPDAEPSTEPGAPAVATNPAPATAGGWAAWAVIAGIGLVLVLLLVLTITGSGDDDAPASATAAGPCAPSVEEPLDPSSVVRLLPNAPEPTYATDPPTSGAFLLGPQVPPSSTDELTKPVQVGLLAEGTVLIQYRDIDADDQAALEALAGDGVVVAPNNTLTSRVVATAWQNRQVCTSVDTDTLRRFVTLHGDQGPQAGPTGTSPTTTG